MVAHSTGNYVGSRGATTNHAEGYFSQLNALLEAFGDTIPAHDLPNVPEDVEALAVKVGRKARTHAASTCP